MTPESEQRDELVLKLITNHGRGMQRLSEAGRLEKKWRGTYGPKRAS